jgi:hypothetical protein
MQLQEFFTHYPSRLLRVGLCVLGVFAVIFGVSLHPILDQPNFPYPSRRASQTEELQALSSLLPSDLQLKQLEFDLFSVENLLLLSLCPMKPDGSGVNALAHVKIKGSNLTRLVPLPAKIGLLFNDQGGLVFKEDEESFWMETSLKEDGSLLTSLFVECGEKIQKASFSRQPMEPPLQKAEELPCSEPFRVLSKARWLGVDLVDQLDAGRVEQKMEIGTSRFNVSEDEWIYWDENHWAKAVKHGAGKGKPLAKIHALSSQSLEWDAWSENGEFHVRFPVPLQSSGTPRVKIEEWFSSVRIRSDKQISCILEKQCLILREGDWILKENNRWRVLRKPEERLHLIQGKRSGDLIVLDTIDMKRKSIQGQFIYSNRAQGLPVELTATSCRIDRKAASPQVERTSRMGRLP